MERQQIFPQKISFQIIPHYSWMSPLAVPGGTGATLTSWRTCTPHRTPWPKLASVRELSRSLRRRWDPNLPGREAADWSKISFCRQVPEPAQGKPVTGWRSVYGHCRRGCKVRRIPWQQRGRERTPGPGRRAGSTSRWRIGGGPGGGRWSVRTRWKRKATGPVHPGSVKRVVCERGLGGAARRPNMVAPP